MADKKKAAKENTAAASEEKVQTAEETSTSAVPANSEKAAPSKAEKHDKNIKAKAARNKKPNIFKRMWRKIKEVFSELKKVTWPSFSKTVGQTGVVIVVVLFFTVIIGAANAGFLALYQLLIGIGV